MSTPLPITEPRGPPPAYYTTHIIRLPATFLHMQFLIFLCACAVLGLSIYSLHFGDGDHGNVWTLIIAAASLLALPYFLISSLVDSAAILYHRTAILVLTIFGLLGWAAEFIDLAFEITGAWTCYRDANNSRVCYREPSLSDKPYYREMIAEATLGGIIFGLLFVLLITFSVYLHRARREGRPVNWWVAKQQEIARAGVTKPTFAEEQGGRWNLQRDALAADGMESGVVR